MSKGKSILLGLLVGTTTSAVVTLLTTPSSGKDVRVRIKDQSIEWKNSIDNIIQEGLNLKNQIAKTSKEGAALINELTQEMQTSIEERSEEHTSELQSRGHLVCRLLLEKKNK